MLHVVSVLVLVLIFAWGAAFSGGERAPPSAGTNAAGHAADCADCEAEGGYQRCKCCPVTCCSAMADRCCCIHAPDCPCPKPPPEDPTRGPGR